MSSESKQAYTIMLTSIRYQRKYPGSDPRKMEDMKHFAEAVGHSTPGRLDKEKKKATIRSIRNKIRKFMSQWQRETNLAILKDVHDSMASISHRSELTKVLADYSNP